MFSADCDHMRSLPGSVAKIRMNAPPLLSLCCLLITPISKASVPASSAGLIKDI